MQHTFALEYFGKVGVGSEEHTHVLVRDPVDEHELRVTLVVLGDRPHLRSQSIPTSSGVFLENSVRTCICAETISWPDCRTEASNSICSCDGCIFKAERFSQSEKRCWIDSLVIPHDELHKHSSSRLHDSYLQVRVGDESRSDESVHLGVTRFTHHEVSFRFLLSHGDSRHHVGSQVDSKDQHC